MEQINSISSMIKEDILICPCEAKQLLLMLLKLGSVLLTGVCVFYLFPFILHREVRLFVYVLSTFVSVSISVHLKICRK